ncbi:hypothetical protein AB1Y20_002741 [Prymnesium parvum]|uniref:IMS import disulfide relay-system CHCH-CHCH-like Cx9C domain-containing protein n=1 Tax=Prymnesium parvum TaxID=97485 RepID=A0AB34J9X4_PRYPA
MEPTSISKLRKAYAFPFSCQPAINAHHECCESRGHWAKCTATQEAKDKCIEEGERTKFVLEQRCSRAKSRLDACVLNRLDCEEKFQTLMKCVSDVLEERSTSFIPTRMQPADTV